MVETAGGKPDMKEGRITVALVEDDAGTRENLLAVLEASARLKCLCACAAGEEALAKLPGCQPEVELMTSNCPASAALSV